MCQNIRLSFKPFVYRTLLSNSFCENIKNMCTVPYKDKCTIAVGQLSSTNDKTHNLDQINNLVSSAVEKHGAEIVFLPEASDYMATSEKELVELAETLEGPIVTSLKNLALTKKVWLCLGFHEKCNNDVTKKVYNTQIMINSSGNLVSLYRKLHLFNVILPEKNIDMQESKVISPGTKIVEPVETPAGKVGMLICYDLRFPELSTTLRKMGASILTYPSAFTCLTGEAHWEALLKARAIENQCYVVAAAQIGQHNPKRVSYGRSMIVDPWGKILSECSRYDESCTGKPSVITALVDRNIIKDVRSRMPVFNHRRDEIYQINIDQSHLELLNSDMKFSDKNIPANTIFYQTKLSFAFTNIRCVVPGHVLVSSKRIVAKICELTNEEIADMFQAVVFIQKIMEKIHKVHSTTLVVQDGVDAGQTVPHVHCHILPRHPGDFLNNDDIYTSLAKHDKENSIHIIRSPIEMVEEAQMIKNAIQTMGIL